MTEATYGMALKFPGVKFIAIDQAIFKDEKHPDWPLPNLVNITYNEDQSGFLVGALAARMSNSHRIGAVCGTSAVPPVWRFGEGYRSGAAFADKKFGMKTMVTVIYHDDVGFDITFNDPEWGAEIARKLIADGADVIFGCGAKTGNGAVIATAQQGLYAIGVDVDQYYTLPEAAPRLLSSAIKPTTEPVAHLIRLAKQGQFPANGFLYGPPGYAPYHDLAGKVPPDVEEMMQGILAGFLKGTLNTGVSPAKP